MEDSTQLRQAINHVREGKELAKTFEVNIGGMLGKELTGIIDSADLILADLENKHEHFITDKFIKLEDYLGVSYDDMRQHHAHGFNKLLKQQYRLYRKEQSGDLEKFNDPNYIKELAVGYTFDYIRTLTLAKKMGIGPKKALVFAELSNWNNPNTFIALSAKYPDADSGMIVQAVTKKPLDPETFLQERLATFKKLCQGYPNEDIGLLKHAAFRHISDPEGYIKSVAENIDKLKLKFPDVDPNVIKTAATNYTKPEEYITRVLQTANDLAEEFPNTMLRLIKHAVSHNILKPREFIVEVEEKIPKLQAQYPEVDSGVIYRSAVNFKSDPHAFIELYKKTMAELQSKYPEAHPWFLNFVATGHTRNSESYIKVYNQRLAELKMKYGSTVSLDLLEHAALVKDYEKSLKKLFQGAEINEVEFEDEDSDYTYDNELRDD